MMFTEYVINELERANSLDEGIVRLGPDFQYGRYRSSHLATNKKNTRIQHYKNGSYSEETMSPVELRKRHLAQKNVAQRKRNSKMEISQRKRLITMMRRRSLNMKPDQSQATGK